MSDKSTSFTVTVLAEDQTKFGLLTTFKDNQFQSIEIAWFNFEFKINIC